MSLAARDMASKTCLISVENHLGPVVNGCGDNVDFTLLFEDAVLLLAPAVLSILVGVCRVGNLRSRPQKVRAAINYWVKMVGERFAPRLATNTS